MFYLQLNYMGFNQINSVVGINLTVKLKDASLVKQADFAESKTREWTLDEGSLFLFK